MEDFEAVKRALTANRANTLALLGCLRETLEAKPFREAEAAVEGSRALALTMQSPHALYAILLKCGAVEAIEVPEETVAEGSAPTAASAVGAGAAAFAAGPEAVDSPVNAAFDSGEDVALPDMPVDYLLSTTEAGRRALEVFEPTRRFEELMAGEPDGYDDAYACVLGRCEAGASKNDIEAALAGHPALAFPKPIYPGYFISKLETIDGISWDGAWRTTEAGQRMRALLA